MNNRNKLKVFFLCAFVSFFTIRCNDFLNQVSPSNYTVATYYRTADDAEQAVTAIYASIYQSFNLQDWYLTLFRTGTMNTIFTGGAGRPNYSLIKDLANISNISILQTFWQSCYKGIANANIAIDRIPGITMDSVRKKNLLGQAHFLRGYFYFNLVRMFGDVPLITKPILGLGDKQVEPERTPVEAVYDQVVKDLKVAESSGLPFNSDDGRVSEGAVKSLLSTVYLTMAGYPLQAGNQYYQLAADEAGAVIDSNGYHLFPDYGALRDPAAENKEGFIWEIQFNTTTHPNTSLQQSLIPKVVPAHAYGFTIQIGFATKEFVEAFPSGDKRVKAFFFNENPPEGGSNPIPLDNYYILKWLDDEAWKSTGKSGLNWPVIRYAEVLLNYAEASNEVSGPTPEAYAAINEIRQRADIPDLSGLSKDDFRKAVWIERYHEMCYENKIWFLMVRTRKALDFATNTFDDYVGHEFPYGVTVADKDLLFPIPQNEIENNPNLTQNPGY